MRSRIFYNLNESTYNVKYEGFEFKFSSLLYMGKFENRVNEYVQTNINKFYSRYRWVAGGDFVNKLKYTFAVDLYSRIEKRGFLIKQVGVQHENDEVRGREIARRDKAV